MSIQRIHIEGFKSLKDVTWEPGALNVVIGPNGSGKSNLLNFLKLVCISSEGGLKKFLTEHDAESDLLWDRQATSLVCDIIVFVPGDQQQYHLMNYVLKLSSDDPFGTLSLDEEVLREISPVNHREYTKGITYISRNRYEVHVSDSNGLVKEIDQTRVPELETILSLSKGPFFEYPLVVLWAFLSEWYVIEKIDTDAKVQLRQPAPVRHDPYLRQDGQNLVSVLHTLYSGDRVFKQRIDAAMVAAFGKDYSELIFPPAGSQKVEMRVRWNSLKQEQPALVLSDGTLRFLCLVTLLSEPNPPPLIAIDEPETGLHPRMLPIIAEYAAEASKKTQIIFTTHSPQFLDAFRDVKPTTTVATWEDGQTKLATLDGDELDYWLREYTLGSLFTSGELENMAADIREKQMQAQA